MGVAKIEDVAPYTGAWIEINSRYWFSHVSVVAPYTGAWIEIKIIIRVLGKQESHPTRVRGLKYEHGAFVWLVVSSHPTRVRGLKYYLSNLNPNMNKVAPYTGAWIEILS